VHLNTVLLPKWRHRDFNFTEDEIEAYSIGSDICKSTAYLWMLRLGFTYCCLKKHFYTDNHERSSTVKARLLYIERQRVRVVKEPVWMQMTIEAAQSSLIYRHLLDIRDPILVYKYCAADPLNKTPEVVDSVEFHVDLDDLFFQGVYPGECEADYKRYNGLRSVRYPVGRLVIHIGQDESIYKANSFSSRVWQSKYGQPLRPKGPGTGVMVSACVSRVTGFNPILTSDQLAGINAQREGKSYADAAAAKEVRGTHLKAPLLTSPLLVKLKHGSTREGWWNYSHQIVQMEDVCDVLKYVYPECDICFEVDNSSGHGKAKVDGLNVAKMSSSWGGKQPKLRDSIITENCLGPYNPLLKVGDTQCMVFAPGCLPPHFDHFAPQNDQSLGATKMRNMYKAELVLAIVTAYPLMKVDKLKVDELRSRAVELKIATTLTEDHIKEGYMHKAKGVKQVLFERGWLDPSNIGKYYFDKRGANEEEEPYCLQTLLEKCADFEAEETMMVFIMRELGVEVEMSPICHPELAGAGVEYDWGKSKKFYRKKRSAIPGSLTEEAFELLVDDSLRGGADVPGSDAPLQLASVLRFARKAHFFKLAYLRLSGGATRITLSEIEATVKTLQTSTYKEHRAVKTKNMLSEKAISLA